MSTSLNITLPGCHPKWWCQRCLLVLLSITTRIILSSFYYFMWLGRIYIYIYIHIYIYIWKESASAQIIYHCSTSPRSIPGIVIYIFTTGKVWQGHVLISYAIDGEVNYNQYSTHNRVSQKVNVYMNSA